VSKKWKAPITAGFRKAHVRTFGYSIRNMNYRQLSSMDEFSEFNN